MKSLKFKPRMTKLIVSLGIVFLIGAGCAAEPTASTMPDTFYAHGSWRFDGDESVINFGVKGVAIIDMQFTRETEDQYLIEGRVAYDDESFSCDIFPRFTICPLNTCEVTSSTIGELTGVAVVRDGKLVMTPRWVVQPNELVTYSCSESATTTNGGFAVWQTMGPLGAKIVEETWSVDISGSFIDELPQGEVTDASTISANFTTEANGVTAEGLIGFYRNKPE